MNRGTIILALLGLAVFVGMTAPLLVEQEWDPTVFIKFPEEAPKIVEYGESLLGDVTVAPAAGHDGKFFFIQAMDPFYLNPDDNAYLLDDPVYRGERMLYPTIAGGFGIFPPLVTAWALYLLNGIVVVVGTPVTARLSMRLGGPAILGLAFALNPGVLSAIVVDTADPLALLFIVLAVDRMLLGRDRSAVLFFAAAALTRESMIAGFLGYLVYKLWRKRTLEWFDAIPLAAPMAWWAYLQMRIGNLGVNVEIPRVASAPFVGFAKSLQSWLTDPDQWASLVLGVVFMVLCLVTFVKMFAGKAVAFVGSGFALVGVMMSEAVWSHYFDATRALAPLFTLYVLTIPRTAGPLRGQAGLTQRLGDAR